MKSIQTLKRRRAANFTEDDRWRLIQLILPVREIINDKNAKRINRLRKSAVWKEVTDKFNSGAEVNRSTLQLKVCYEAIKHRFTITHNMGKDKTIQSAPSVCGRSPAQSPQLNQPTGNNGAKVPKLDRKVPDALPIADLNIRSNIIHATPQRIKTKIESDLIEIENAISSTKSIQLAQRPTNIMEVDGNNKCHQFNQPQIMIHSPEKMLTSFSYEPPDSSSCNTTDNIELEKMENQLIDGKELCCNQCHVWRNEEHQMKLKEHKIKMDILMLKKLRLQFNVLNMNANP